MRGDGLSTKSSFLFHDFVLLALENLVGGEVRQLRPLRGAKEQRCHHLFWKGLLKVARSESNVQFRNDGEMEI